jgi:eukaryotic translation initiation factor 2C
LWTNFFKVKIPSDLTLFHYDVEILPTVPRAVKRKVMQAAVEKDRAKFSGQFPVFDGEQALYCHKKMNDNEITMPEVNLDDRGRQRQFKVTVKFTGHVVQCGDLERVIGNAKESRDIITAVELVLRQGAVLKPDVVTVGRSFFTPPTHDSTVTLGDGREVWFGYYQSAKPSMWKTLLLNIDIAATAFYTEQAVINFLQDVLGHKREQLNDFERRKFSKEIKGLKIVVTHLPYPRQYRVNDITTKTASEQTFPLTTEGGDVVSCTVQKYFADTYQIHLQYPHLPCLHVGPKDKNIYIPMECCRIAKGQRCAKKLTDLQLRNMIKHTAKPAHKRRQDIMEKVKSAGFERDPVMREYGLRVHNRMEEVEGRVLDPPAIKYKGNETVSPRNGAWDMRHREFLNGVEINEWAVAVCNNYFSRQSHPPSKEDIRKFTSELTRHSRSLGMRMAPQPSAVEYQRTGQSAEQFFKGLIRRNEQLKLIMAILPQKGSGSGYAEVKRAGDNLIGVRTQCVVASTLRKTNPPTLTNVCLKINAKFGGTNSIISRSSVLGNKSKPVIVMGADVTHPAPGETKKPSIAALVASMDVNATDYRAYIRVQERRKEIITDMKEMVKGMMKAFYRTNHGVKPERILFYRDGVSEGQFQTVLEKELQQIQMACEELERGYRPAITFLVVQKRHHARFFPIKDDDKVGKSGNVPAGTTVDRRITHPTDHDFYLCSHNGIQGTSKPCHYYVLHDDYNYSADELQDVTFQLCHLFPRCNRSVSYPAPAYCAHLAAFRARHHLQDWENKNDSGSVVSGDSEEWSQEDMAQAIRIDSELQQTGMYFA